MQPNRWSVYWADGAVDITLNGRAFRYGLDDVDSAVATIKRDRKYTNGDKITVDDDH